MAAKQILIVEDERPIREMIAFGLRRAVSRCVKRRMSVRPRRGRQ